MTQQPIHIEIHDDNTRGVLVMHDRKPYSTEQMVPEIKDVSDYELVTSMVMQIMNTGIPCWFGTRITLNENVTILSLYESEKERDQPPLYQFIFTNIDSKAIDRGLYALDLMQRGQPLVPPGGDTNE